jgi:hypothetical protein
MKRIKIHDNFFSWPGALSPAKALSELAKYGEASPSLLQGHLPSADTTTGDSREEILKTGLISWLLEVLPIGLLYDTGELCSDLIEYS